MTKDFDEEDDGVSLGHIQHALEEQPPPAPAPATCGVPTLAGVCRHEGIGLPDCPICDPRTKAPAPAQDEREPEQVRCTRLEREYRMGMHHSLADMFSAERAAVRAECEALIASAHEAADIATENYDKVAAEVQALKREVERRDDIILELRGGRAAERELERLKARVRELERAKPRCAKPDCAREISGEYCWYCDEKAER